MAGSLKPVLVPAALGAGGGLKVDGSGTALPVSGTVTANAGTGTQAVSLATLPALVAGTAAIGKLAANTGVIIGDVNVVSSIPGVAATSLGKAEDAAHTSGDTGVMMLAVRNDAGTALAGTTGDYIPMSTDSSGALRVVGSSGTTQYAEDSVAASGDSLVVVGAVRRDTAATSVSASGDYEALSTNATGALRVTIDSYGTGSAAAPGTDGIGAFLATNSIMNGTTALTPKFATIAASTSGNNTLVAAVTSKKIRVLAYNFIGNGAVNAKFQSGASGTDVTGLKYMPAAGAGLVAPFNPVGWFETASGVLLNLNLSTGVAVGGELVYVEV